VAEGSLPSAGPTSLRPDEGRLTRAPLVTQAQTGLQRKPVWVADHLLLVRTLGKGRELVDA